MASELEIKNSIQNLVDRISNNLKGIAYEIDTQGALSSNGNLALNGIRGDITRLFSLYESLSSSAKSYLIIKFEGRSRPFSEFKMFLMNVSSDIRNLTGRGLFN